MNKTVTVNIGGMVFHIDENAYEMFKHYLESIRRHFTTSEGRDEIMQDIESRIAEMFSERIKDSKQVITIQDVEEVTAQMGKPEQITDEEKSTSDAAENISQHSEVKRRLFRDPDDKLLGGVCSGIANYFGVDPVWIRLFWALLFFLGGTGLFIYIILWIIIPEAKTATDKLQMKGVPVTVSSIGKNVKEETEKRKRGDDSSKARNVISSFFSAIGEIVRALFRFLGKLIVVIMVIIGLLVAFCFLLAFFGIMGMPGITLPPFINYLIASDVNITLAFIGAFLGLALPFIMLVYAGIRNLMNIKTSNRVVNFMALSLWIIGVIICLIVGTKTARQFVRTESVKKQVTLMQPATGKLYLSLENNEPDEKKYNTYFNWDDEWSMSTDEKKISIGDIRLDIVKSNNDNFELTEIMYAHGSSRGDAETNASKINYSFSQKDSLVTFDRHFHITVGDKYRMQRVQLILRVPVGKQVFLSETMNRIIYDIDNIGDIWDRDMTNRTWEMTEQGLKCIDCTGEEKSISGKEIVIDHGDTVHAGHDGVRITKDGKEVVRIDEHGVIINSDEQ